MTGRARAAVLALLGAGTLALAACGDATVESSDVTETATASEETGTSESESAETSTSTSSTSETTRTSARNSEERDITEPGAARASSAPDGRMPLSGDDEDFLDDLIADGIDVEGVEDQLIAAGHVQCGAGANDGREGDAAVVDAVAGQIVAQERTDGDEAAVSQSIAKAAESAYC
ncbi:hypothetical protein ACFWGD_07680 [Corynebacterium sp. NPDC060344]|uniref:hypothetical protein n=1 Tax=Corynebacterium sp. NPDC060344 TaxID=3347101 RepID=UPI00365A3C27